MQQDGSMMKDIRPASTVVLIREKDGSLQVYLVKRSRKSGFFPGAYVFPGGTVDPDEWRADPWMGSLDLSPAALMAKFGDGLPLNAVVAYGLAAIRETFEEAGVLLAAAKPEFASFLHHLADLRTRGRLDVGWFLEHLSEGRRLLSFSRLHPWSHWITPEAMKRRFDTRFFVALMPRGQDCAPDNRETVHGLWVSPEEGLAGNRRGEVPLSPPTLITLHELSGFRDIRALERDLQGRTWGVPRLPVLKTFGGGKIILEPWDPMYGKEEDVCVEDLEAKILEPGEPVSRVWLKDGVWLPVSP